MSAHFSYCRDAISIFHRFMPTMYKLRFLTLQCWNLTLLSQQEYYDLDKQLYRRDSDRPRGLGPGVDIRDMTTKKGTFYSKKTGEAVLIECVVLWVHSPGKMPKSIKDEIVHCSSVYSSMYEATALFSGNALHSRLKFWANAFVWNSASSA